MCGRNLAVDGGVIIDCNQSMQSGGKEERQGAEGEERVVCYRFYFLHFVFFSFR